MSIPSRTPDELKKIAQDIVHGLIFTSVQIPAHEMSSLSQIFLPLALVSGTTVVTLKADPPAMLYAYYTDALPMYVNGFPMFYAVHMVTKEDMIVIWDMVDRMQTAMNAIEPE